MTVSDTIRSVISIRSGLIIPATCAMIAQFMQHFYGTGYDASDLSESSLLHPLLLFSFVKIIATVVLAIHLARALIAGTSTSQVRSGTGKADTFLAFIVGINVLFACIILLSVGFIESKSFANFIAFGISRTTAKIGLVCLIFALMAPLNKRVFRDVSLAIASSATLDTQTSLAFDPNKVFLKSLMRNVVRYVLPLYAVHILIAVGISKFGGMFFVQAAVDSVVLVALGLLAGYAIFRSHEEVLSMAR